MIFPKEKKIRPKDKSYKVPENLSKIIRFIKIKVQSVL